MILVVEDNVDIAALLCELFGGMNHECRCSPTVREAIAMIEAAPPDIIVSDYMLPDGTGVDVIDRFPDIPAIIITAALGVTHGRAQILRKPFDLKEIETAVEARLARSQTQ
jgi:DNA-binding response OmpR family regulator